MERQNNMIPQGMPSMQRPQAGNMDQQIYALIMNNLRNKSANLPPGWQQTFELAQRASRIMQLVSALRLLEPEIRKCINTAEGFEERCIHESPNKDVYLQKFTSKLQEVHQKREQHVRHMQPVPRAQMGGMPMNNGNFAMPQNDLSAMNIMQNMQNMQSMQNMGMPAPNVNMNMNMNMNMTNFMPAGATMPNGVMDHQNGQQVQNPNFPAQLQRPMQASPLPQQHLPQQQSATLDPANLQAPLMPGQPSNMARSTSQQQQQPNMGMNMQQQAQMSGVTNQEVTDLAKAMYDNTPDEKRLAIRTRILEQQDPQRRDQILQQSGDPLIGYFRLLARDALMKQKNGQGGMMQAGNANNALGSANQNFNMSNMLGQQASAIKSQECGEQVVPASNNPGLQFGGQTNGSQSMNPQLLGNPKGQANDGAHLQKLLAIQKAKQRQQQIQSNQAQLAQSHALAQQHAQQQLHGQPGGLNASNALTGGQLNSPAMKMLNRPMAPPGQPAPLTPQPNRAQNVTPSPTPGNGASQVIQHHQNLLNQNVQHNGQTPALAQMNSLPQNIRDRLSELNPQQINELIARQQSGAMMNNSSIAGMPGSVNPNGAQMNNQQQMMRGMPGIPTGSAVPGFNSQPPAGLQQAQRAAMHDSSANTRIHQQQNMMRIKAFDFRPFPKELPQQLGLSVPDGLNGWGRLKAHVHATRDVLPPDIMQRLTAAQAEYFRARPEEMRLAMQEFQQRYQAIQQHQHNQQLQLQQQQQNPASRPPSIPNGQAPPAQMVQPNGAMQQQPPPTANMNPSMINRHNQNQVRMPPQPQPPSQQEIQRARQAMPHTANMSDDHIRTLIMESRYQQAQHLAMSQQQNQKITAQMQKAQMVANGAQQNNPVLQINQQQMQQPSAAQPNQRSLAQPHAPQAANKTQGQKRPKPTNDDVMEIPNPNLTAKGSAPQTTPMQSNQPQRSLQGQGPPSALRPPTREQLVKMTPEERTLAISKWRQIEAARKAQNVNAAMQQSPQPAQGQPKPQEQAQAQSLQDSSAPAATEPASIQIPVSDDDRKKASSIYQEIVRSNPKGPTRQLKAEEREYMLQHFKKMWASMQRIDKTYPVAMKLLGEPKMKEAMVYGNRYFHNVSEIDGSATNEITLSLDEFKAMQGFISQYYMALRRITMSKGATVKLLTQNGYYVDASIVGAAAPTGQAQLAQHSSTTTKPQQPATLERKPSQQGGRKASTSTKTPPAPTVIKSFDWGLIPSVITADKLKLPPQKKRKNTHDSPDSKASGAAGSPPSNLNMTEQADKLQPPATAQQLTKTMELVRPRYKCDDPLCEASIVGFETEALLKEHKDDTHQPIAHPLSFMLQNAAKALGLDGDGNELKRDVPKYPAAQARAPPASAAMTGPSGSRKGGVQTPGGTQGATPATPASGSKAISKSATVTPAGKRVADNNRAVAGPTPESPEEIMTLFDTIAERNGFENVKAPLEVPEMAVAPASATAEENADDDLPARLRREFQRNTKEFWVESFEDVGDVDDWATGIPTFDLVDREDAVASSSSELTPSDRSLSSQGSDLSETDRMIINFRWDAFGNGDTSIPPSLAKMEKLMVRDDGANDGKGGSGAAAAAPTGDSGDTEMADVDGGDKDADEEGEKKKADTEPMKMDGRWDWNEDLIFDFDWQGVDAGDDLL